jgi:hypothetical protein
LIGRPQEAPYFKERFGNTCVPHRHYDARALRADYGTINGYVAPREAHATNGIMARQWQQNKHRCRELIGVHMHVRADGGDATRNWRTPNRHYHAGMAAGENTFNAHTARVLLRHLAARGGAYDVGGFLREYVRFMATPGAHNDSYAEAVHRQVGIA